MKLFALAVFCVTISTCFGDKGILCKNGQEEWNGTAVNSNAGTSRCKSWLHYCAAASCIYLDSDFKKAIKNVTFWGCVERNGSGCGLAEFADDVLCDPCFVGEKDVGMTNGDFIGVFPTAAEYKLAGRKPPLRTTEKVPLLKTATGNGVESAFINPLLVMLTFVLAILCRF
uniref:Secreted protein n=1 Tax=Globodera pallida TaxID=36090 RepID=A0A183BR11_GLOPA